MTYKGKVKGGVVVLEPMLNPRDEPHAKLAALTASLRRPLVTTTWGLTEVGDALARTESRALFGRLLSRLLSDRRAVVVPTTDDLFERRTNLYVLLK